MLKLYINEIRNRTYLISVSLLVSIVVCYLYKEVVLFIFTKPCLNFRNEFTYFITTNLTEIFVIYLDIIFFVVYQIGFLCVFYHSVLFFSPALYDFEYERLKSYVVIWLYFFILFIFLFNYEILPKTWSFFTGFQERAGDHQVVSMYFEARLLNYVSYYKALYSICLISSQIFFLTYMLFEFLLENTYYIKNLRKTFYVIYFFSATLLTPPDIVSQVLLGLFFILFFETILLIRILKRNLVR